MKSLKHGFLAVASVLALATTLFYTACEKDSCTDLQCKNGGSCADDFCRCKTGFEGAECEIKQSSRFVGRWSGSTRCTNETPDNPIGPNINDTLTIVMISEPVTVGLVLKQQPGDTVIGTVNGMEIVIPDRNVGDARRTSRVVLNGKNLNYFITNTVDINRPSTQTDCNFIGYGPTLK